MPQLVLPSGRLWKPIVLISRQCIKYLIYTTIQYYAPSNNTCNGTWKTEKYK